MKNRSLLRTATLTLVAACLAVNLAFSNAKVPAYPKAKVSYDDFKELTAEVESHRAARLVDLNTFLRMSQEPGVIILDTRSDHRFDSTHIKGARHLAFTEFTQENLAGVIPSFDTKILIYCNNNFEGNERDFAGKVTILRGTFNSGTTGLPSNAVIQPRPRSLALNVPTYINLYGYGYRNVYELDELVSVKDPRIQFESTPVRSPEPLKLLSPEPEAKAAK